MSNIENRTSSNGWLFALVSSVAVVMAIGLGLGFVLGRSTAPTQPASAASNSSLASPLKLLADSAAKGKSISLATGRINGDVEGLFILDHLTGNLQCWLLNPKTGDVGGIYRTNVAEILIADKGDEPDFVMTTGGFFFTGAKGGNVQPAETIVYVAEGNSGNVAGFSLNYNRSGIQRGIVQSGLLEVVCQGPSRNMAQRDQ